MKGKRFLYVGGFQLPDKNAAAHRVLGIAKILKELGYEVVFLDVDETMQNDDLSVMHIEAGFDTYSQKRPVGTGQWVQYILNPLHVEEVLNKYDDWSGVIAYNYPAGALHKLKNICHKRGIKVFADCTEWYQLEYVKSARDIALVIDTFFRMRVVQKRLDGMVGISHFLGDYYKKHLPTIVLPPLVDKDEEKWSNGISKIQEGVVSLAYVGSPGVPGQTKDKLIEIIRTICKADWDIKLNIVGISRAEYCGYYPDVEKMIEGRNNIVFFGRLSHVDALKVIKESDYTIFYREVSKVSTAGFPTKFVESISCGVPVITNGTSDLHLYIREGRNGVLLKNENFETQLFSLLKDISSKEKKHLEVEAERFDYRTYVGQVEDWLNEIK
jgi:glycosyltransferase involved in cell wall biosynthesis